MLPEHHKRNGLFQVGTCNSEVNFIKKGTLSILGNCRGNNSCSTVLTLIFQPTVETCNTWTVLVVTVLGNYKIMFHLVIWRRKQIWHNGKLWICGDGKIKVQCIRDFITLYGWHSESVYIGVISILRPINGQKKFNRSKEY